ncbi:MAG TPA: metallopeptidase family protein [Candidatus Didemnitutus sp.]|nr:metallopeptidase family protein [Candidatus Didemnitutus sp.]
MKPAQLHSLAEKAVAAAHRALPAEVRDAAGAVAVCFEDRPENSPFTGGEDDDLLGLFVGHTHTGPDGSDPLPPQILLFLENLWDFADEDEAAFRSEVRTTYLHELGHYFGWDEDEVARRGLE